MPSSNLLRLTVANALFYTALGIGSPLINLFFQSLGASYARISLILVLFVLTSIVTSTLYARFANRLGPRRYWLVGGLALQSAAYLLLARTNAIGAATFGRLMEGVGVALYATVSLAIVGELLRDSPRKGRTMGWYRGLGSLTFAAGALLGGQLADRASIHAAFIAEAICFALAALVGLSLEAAPRPRPVLATSLQAVVQYGASTAPERRRTTLPVQFLAGTVLIMIAISAASSMFPNYLSSLGRTFGAIGALWALAAALELPAMLVTGLVSDRTGRPPLLAAGAAAVAAVQILYIAAARFAPIVFAAQFVRAFGFASYTANSMTYTAEVSSEADRALNSGAYNVSQNAGQLLGVALGGTLVQVVGFTVMFAACTVVAICSTVAFVMLGAVKVQTEKPIS